MSEEQAIKEIENYLDYEGSVSIQAIAILYSLYNKEKEKNKELHYQLEIEKIDNKYNQEESNEETISRYKIKEKITYYEELIKTNPEDEEILRHIIQALNEILEESEEK